MLYQISDLDARHRAALHWALERSHAVVLVQVLAQFSLTLKQRSANIAHEFELASLLPVNVLHFKLLDRKVVKRQLRPSSLDAGDLLFVFHSA
jgi:hypothetical protein